MTTKKKREPNPLKEMIKEHLAEGRHPQELLEE